MKFTLSNASYLPEDKDIVMAINFSKGNMLGVAHAQLEMKDKKEGDAEVHGEVFFCGHNGSF